MNRRIFEWVNDSEAGGAPHREDYRNAMLTHPEDCRSLSDVWLPRNDGRTCISDWFWCEGCKLSFANEVTYGYDDTTESFLDGYYCDCCNRKREQ